MDVSELPKELAPFVDSTGRFKAWPVKRKLQEPALAFLASKFQPGIEYSEGDVNEVLMLWHTFRDWARLRRDLFDHGYLERDADGSRYWLAERRQD